MYICMNVSAYLAYEYALRMRTNVDMYAHRGCEQYNI